MSQISIHYISFVKFPFFPCKVFLFFFVHSNSPFFPCTVSIYYNIFEHYMFTIVNAVAKWFIFEETKLNVYAFWEEERMNIFFRSNLFCRFTVFNWKQIIPLSVESRSGGFIVVGGVGTGKVPSNIKQNIRYLLNTIVKIQQKKSIKNQISWKEISNSHGIIIFIFLLNLRR